MNSRRNVATRTIRKNSPANRAAGDTATKRVGSEDLYGFAARALAVACVVLFATISAVAAAPPLRDIGPARLGGLVHVDLRDVPPGDHVVSTLVELGDADPKKLRLVDQADPAAPAVRCQVEVREISPPPRATPDATDLKSGGLRAVNAKPESSRRETRLWWIVRQPALARREAVYQLEVGAAPAGTELVVERSPEAMVVKSGRHSILRYNIRHVPAPEGADPKYGRSAHIHPVWTPSGRVVSDEFPPDHLHQSGVFLAYTKGTFEGRDTNFWDLAGGKGRVRHKSVKNVQAGPVFASFEVEHEHVDLTSGQEKVALVETWDVRVWNVGGPEAGYWSWDVRSVRRCASAEPLKLPAYHYGGMALRGARGWNVQNSRFLTSEGKSRLDGNHSRPKWCDLLGPVDGEPAGLALFTHPDNFRFPEPLRIHPTMPYMVYTPSQLGDWEIAPGDEPASVYRFIAHDRELNKEQFDPLWNDFAHPPSVTPTPSR